MSWQQAVCNSVTEYPAFVERNQTPGFWILRVQCGQRARRLQPFGPVPPHQIALLLHQRLEQWATFRVRGQELPQTVVVVVDAVTRWTLHGKHSKDHRIGEPELTGEDATLGTVQHCGPLLHWSDVVVVVIRPAEPGPQHQRIETLEECARCVGGADECPR